MAKRVVLAYSGGLDTSVAVRWMIEEMGVEVVAVALRRRPGRRLGGPRRGPWPPGRSTPGGRLPRGVRPRLRGARPCGPTPSTRAGTRWCRPCRGRSSCKHLVDVARRFGADAVAHGCTGKGNDQVRFEVATRSLAPDLEVHRPGARLGHDPEPSPSSTRPASASRSGPPRSSSYSIDDNLWGRAIECGEMEDPWARPPEGVWSMTTVRAARSRARSSSASSRARPCRSTAGPWPLHELIVELNDVVGAYGWGRIDMVENRRVGIKSRETYECAGRAGADHGPRRPREHLPRA